MEQWEHRSPVRLRGGDPIGGHAWGVAAQVTPAGRKHWRRSRRCGIRTPDVVSTGPLFTLGWRSHGWLRFRDHYGQPAGLCRESPMAIAGRKCATSGASGSPVSRSRDFRHPSDPAVICGPGAGLQGARPEDPRLREKDRRPYCRGTVSESNRSVIFVRFRWRYTSHRPASANQTPGRHQGVLTAPRPPLTWTPDAASRKSSPSWKSSGSADFPSSPTTAWSVISEADTVRLGEHAVGLLSEAICVP